MNIGVLLTLGMVIGTLGSAVKRNDTIEDALDATGDDVHDETMTKNDMNITNVRDIKENGTIENTSKNNSEVVEKPAFDVSVSDLDSVGRYTSANDVNNSNTNDQSIHNSDENVGNLMTNGSFNHLNNIENSVAMDDVKNPKVDHLIKDSEEILEKSLIHGGSNHSNDIENSSVDDSRVNDKSKNNSAGIIRGSTMLNRTSSDPPEIEIPVHIDPTDDREFNNKSKNVILILGEGSDDGSIWRKLNRNYSFAVEGSLQSCKAHKEFDESSDVQTDDDEHDCHRRLNYIIDDLMAYARTTKGINTIIASEMNLTTASAPNFDNSDDYHHNHHRSKLIGGIVRVGNNALNRRYHSQLSTSMRSLHMDNQSASSVPSISTKIQSSTPTTTRTSIHHHTNINRDRIWELFNIITKIRWDFLRDIFDSMHKSSIFNTPRKKNSREHVLHSPARQSTAFIELITKTLMSLQAKPDENGFLMVIITPYNELPTVYNIIENQSTVRDNLIIMSHLDTTDDNKMIPYVVNGVGSDNFKGLNSFHELSSTIKLLLDNCQGVCHDEEVHPLSMSIPTKSLIPKKRVARLEDDDTLMDDERSDENEGTENDPSQDDNDDGGDDDSDDRPKSSGISFHCQKNSLTLTITFISSILVPFSTQT